MSISQVVRRLLGRRFQPVGEAYRAFFVDVHRVAARIARELPRGANCLDIGGGDGIIANALLNLRDDISISMIDVADRIGGFVAERHAARVRTFPATELRNLSSASRFDAFVITDVLHHIPEPKRDAFFAELRTQAGRTECPLILIKDVEPGSPRAVLSLLSDRYITGDRCVSLIGRRQLEERLRRTFGDALASFNSDFPDFPNYCAVVRLVGTPRTA